MIHANELRIGNWVTRASTNLKGGGSKQEVTVVDGNMIKELELHPYIDCNAIHLTPEYLKMFGFSKTMSGTYTIMDVDFFVDIWQGGYVCSVQYSVNEPAWCQVAILYHLHQLQNLYYALTGRELKIDL